MDIWFSSCFTSHMYSSTHFHLPFPTAPLIVLSLKSPVNTFHFFSWISQLHLTLNRPPPQPWEISSSEMLLITTSPLCPWDSCLPKGFSNSICAKWDSSSSLHLNSLYPYLWVPHHGQWHCHPPVTQKLESLTELALLTLLPPSFIQSPSVSSYTHTRYPTPSLRSKVLLYFC